MTTRKTNKPCHGCGSTATHAQNSVCSDCTSLMIEGKAAAADRAAATNLITAQYTTSPYYHLNVSCSAVRYSGHDRFQKALVALVRALSKNLPRGYLCTTLPRLLKNAQDTDLHSAQPCEIRKDYADILVELDAGIQQFIDEVACEHLRKGASIIGQLASGKITVDVFNTMTTGHNRSR
jgi:hypothetical protein